MAGVTGNMTIVVHRAMNLPESNLTSKNDPYIRIRLDTQDSRHSQRGKYQNNSSTNPVFEQKFAFFLQGNEREVCLEIWDDDYLKDDKLAYAIISIQELLQHSDKRPFMVNLMSKGDRGRAGMVELSVIADSISNSRQQQNWQGSQQQYGQNNTSGSSWGSGYGSSGYDTQSKGFPEYGQQQQQQQQESTLHKVARKLGLASDTNAASNVNDQQSSWSSSTSQPSSGSSNVSNMLGSIFGYPMTQQYNNAGVTGNMTIVVLRAMNLPESNFLGKNDPYVRIRLDTQDSRNAQRGKHQSNGATNPVFDQKFAFFLNGNERAVCLEIWDDDYIKDDKLAYALIPVEELMQHTDQRPFTINLMSKGDRGRAGMVELVVIGDNLNYSRQSGMGIGAGQQGWQGQQGQQGWQGSSHHQSSWWPGRDRDREHDRDYNQQQQQPQQEGTMQKVARKLGLGQSDYGNVYGYPVAQQANTTGAVGTMIVNVHRAFNLPESNFLGKNDPYVRIRLDTQDSRHSQRGKHHGNSARNPIFDQRFQFNLQGNEQVICLEFWDDDYIKDDKLAYALIPIEDLLQHADGRPFVVDLVAKGDRGHAGTAEMSVIAPNVSYGQQHQGQSSGWGMSSRHHGHDNTGYGSNYGSQYGSGYGPNYGSGYGSNYGSQYGSGYGPSYGSQYGSGIGAGTQYGTGYGSNYGSGYSGPNYGSSNYGTYNTSSVGSNDRESLLDKGMRKLGITGTDVTSGTGVSSNTGYTTGAPSQTESRIADRQGLGSSNSNLSSGQSAMTGMAAGLPGMPSYGGSGIGSGTSSSGGTGANVGNAGNYSQGSSMPTSGSSYNNDNESLTEKASRKLGLGEHAYDKSVMDQGVTSQRPMSQQGTMVDKPK